MARKVSYKINRTPRTLSAAVRYFVIPFTILAVLFISVGIYTFSAANTMMRQEPKELEDFATNILPAYSLASFTALDGSTRLSGWFFPSRKTAVSTVIMVHDQGQNRLQFDVDTATIYDYFVNKGYNVLSFDLRHSGRSDGNLSTFGYSEWADVLAAISYVRKVSSTGDVILYGFGSGISACLIAIDKLPAANQPLNEFSDTIAALGFNKSYIRGLILDNPTISSDDYIKTKCRASIFAGKSIGQFTIPYAIRLSAGAGKSYNLAAIIARTQIPVHLIYKKSDNVTYGGKILSFVNERLRLFPNLTTTYVVSEETNKSAFTYNTDAYLDSITDYLTRFIN